MQAEVQIGEWTVGFDRPANYGVDRRAIELVDRAELRIDLGNVAA